jgi:hypothetical protein
LSHFGIQDCQSIAQSKGGGEIVNGNISLVATVVAETKACRRRKFLNSVERVEEKTVSGTRQNCCRSLPVCLLFRILMLDYGANLLWTAATGAAKEAQGDNRNQHF